MMVSANIKRLAALHRPYKGRLALALFSMLVTAATEPVVPYLFQMLVDKGFTGKAAFSLWLIPLAVIGIFVIRGLSTFTSTYMMTWSSTRLMTELRRQMFARMLDVPLGFYASHTAGKVINSVMFEVQQIIEMITKVFTSIARSAMTVMGLLAYLLYLNWQLTIVTLILLPLITLVVRSTGKRLKRLNQESLKVNAELTQVIEETIRAQQVIKIFGGETYEKAHFRERSEKLARYVMRTTSTFAATVPVTQLMTACAVAVVVVMALIQSRHGHITVGGFSSFIMAMLMLLTPLKQLAEVNGPLQRGTAALDSVFDLIDQKGERADGKKLARRSEGRIDFDHVDFAYPGSERLALRDVDLHVRPGETVAFVGMSGGGKSTLVNLIPGFFPPQRGRILLDGEPINGIALDSLRAQIALVSQNVVLFDDTLAANIAYGDSNPDRKRIEQAAAAAHLTEMVAALPQGLDTPLGDNGSRLSGGQRQRVAIARAIYKDAPILVLDEATSALDTESERAVQSALDRLMQGRTTFVIAHRLSTIERADRIVVLVNGSITETGTHRELLAKEGVYANLHRPAILGRSRVKTPLIPHELLQGRNKVLFIAHLALGDFTYMQNCFQAVAEAFPDIELHLWVDEVRRTSNASQWPHLKKYSLYDWVGACSFFKKVYTQTYSPELYEQSIEEARRENYPAVISLATLRPHQYAELARKIGPQAFVTGMKEKASVLQPLHFLAYRNLDAVIQRRRAPDEHISDEYADWFGQLFGINIPPEARFPFVNIPGQWTDEAQARLAQWGFSPRDGKLVFVNPFAKTKKRCWPLERVAELVATMQKQEKWRDACFIVNAVPQELENARKAFAAHSLERTQLFSAEDNFFQLPAMLSQCDLIVSVETAVMHLANAVHVPVIALMRQKNPEWVPIDRKNSTVITAARRRDWVDAITVDQVMKSLK